jgi:RNA polymerase sigma factor (sigma-70 family)
VNKNKYANISDNELLERFYAEKNNDYLGALLQRYTLLLFGVSMKYMKNEEDAKDAVQQVFLKVITELQKYKVDYFKSWLYMVAKNYCLMKLRNMSERNNYELNEEMLFDEIDLKANYYEKDQLLNCVEESLNELNGPQKSCLTLFYFQKKSYREISEETGFSVLQIKSYIQNGKRNLKQLVEMKMKTGNAGKQ